MNYKFISISKLVKRFFSESKVPYNEPIGIRKIYVFL